MKTPLRTEVDLGSDHVVLDRDPAKGAYQPPPVFGPCLLWSRSPIWATAELLFYYVSMWKSHTRLWKKYEDLHIAAL